MSITVVTAHHPFGLTRLIKSLHKPDKVWLTSKLQDLDISIWTKLQINLYKYAFLNKLTLSQLLINIQGDISKMFVYKEKYMEGKKMLHVMQNSPKSSFSKKQYCKGLRACSSVEFIRTLCSSTYDTSTCSKSCVKSFLQGFMALKNFFCVRSYVLQGIIQQRRIFQHHRICQHHMSNNSTSSTVRSHNEVTQTWNPMRTLCASSGLNITRCRSNTVQALSASNGSNIRRYSSSNSVKVICTSTLLNIIKYSCLNLVQAFCTSTQPNIRRCSTSNSIQAMCTSTPSNVTKYNCLNLVQASCTSTQPNVRSYSSSNSVKAMGTSSASNVTKYSFLNPVQGFCTSTQPNIRRDSTSNSMQVFYILIPSNMTKYSCSNLVQAFCTSTHPNVRSYSSSNSVKAMGTSSASNVTKYSFLNPVQAFCTSTQPNIRRYSISNSMQVFYISTPSNMTKYSCLNLVQAFCTSTYPIIRRYSTSNSVKAICTLSASNVTKYSCLKLVQAFCTSTHPTIKKRSCLNFVQVFYILSHPSISKYSFLNPVQTFCTSTCSHIIRCSSSNSVQAMYTSTPLNITKYSFLSPVQVFCTSTPNVPKRTPVLLATASILVVSQNGDRFPARALLDQGSEVSFITESLAEKLELTCRFSAVPIIGVGAQRSNIAHRATTFQLISRIDESFKCHVDALMLPELTTCLPAARIVHTQWSHLEGLHLADPDFAKPDKIDIILGAHVYSQIIREGLRRGDVGAPIAQKTCLGWVLSGAINVDVDSECVREPSVN